MFRPRSCVTGVLPALVACGDDPTQLENGPGTGITFTAAGLSDDGVTVWSVDQHFEVQSGSVAATEVGPTMLRGTFEAGMQTHDGTATLQTTDGRDWYATDAGREILREVVEVLEGARDGRPRCPGMAPR